MTDSNEDFDDALALWWNVWYEKTYRHFAVTLDKEALKKYIEDDSQVLAIYSSFASYKSIYPNASNIVCLRSMIGHWVQNYYWAKVAFDKTYKKMMYITQSELAVIRHPYLAETIVDYSDSEIRKLADGVIEALELYNVRRVTRMYDKAKVYDVEKQIYPAFERYGFI